METNSISNISFKSNIKFVSHEQFRSKYSNRNREDFDIVCTGDTKVGENLSTQGIVYCVAGGITSDKAIMWHMTPFQECDFFRSKSLLNRVEKNYNEKIDKENTPHCLLIGGGDADESRSALRKTIERLEQLKIDTKNNASVLWHSFYGQPSAASYNAKEDTWYIPVLGLEKKQSKEQLKLVKDKYSDIFISKNDNAFINDEKIERSLLNTNKSFKNTYKNILNDLKYTFFSFAFSEEKRCKKMHIKQNSGDFHFYGEKWSDLSKDYQTG